MEQETGEHNATSPGSEVDEDEKEKWKRPPSSYGSMKSDSESMDEEQEEGDEGERPVPVLPDLPAPPEARLQMAQSEYPETFFTETTQQTKPPGAMVIETGSAELEDLTEDELEDWDEPLYTCSPEPPEPLEMEGLSQTDENSQPGRLHPEQDLPYIFKTIQDMLARLNNDDIFKFKMWFHKYETVNFLREMFEGDLLDFVDKAIEIHGLDKALSNTINTLDSMEKKEEADELRNKCKKALFRSYLKELLSRKHQVIHEGVVQPGKQSLLKNVYVEPQISTCSYGGVDPSHEFSNRPPNPVQVPTVDTFVGLNNLFRLQKDDGSPVRTVVTTGLPGVGMSVSVAKFCLDWAELCANRDLQYVIKLSFRSLWFLRNKGNSTVNMPMTMLEVMQYYHFDIKDLTLLEEEDPRFLVILDSFDCYLAPLEWEKAPVINDNYTKATMDVLIVNIIRGNVLRGARLWILGRRAAVSQIPSQFIDVFTELQGFSDEMKDEYLTKRFSDAEQARNIVQQYKRVPTIHILARHPFFCWIVATMLERAFRYQGYGVHPPRVTPYLIHSVIVQINRRLQFYYDMMENELKWSDIEKQLLMRLGKMAFRMLEKNASVFSEEDVKEFGLQLTEVVVWSGLCTEMSPSVAPGRRRFCFAHYTYQEFMAALYVFLTFYLESKNILDSGGFLSKSLIFRYSNKSAAGLVQCAVARTLSSPLGQYEMFLRYLCGLLSPACHHSLLKGFLFPHNTPKVGGLADVQQQLEQVIQTAPEDRVDNLKECLRELTQEDD